MRGKSVRSRWTPSSSLRSLCTQLRFGRLCSKCWHGSRPTSSLLLELRAGDRAASTSTIRAVVTGHRCFWAGTGEASWISRSAARGRGRMARRHRWRRSMLTPLKLAAGVVVCLGFAAWVRAEEPPAYRVLKNFEVAGEGRWDYLHGRRRGATDLCDAADACDGAGRGQRQGRRGHSGFEGRARRGSGPRPEPWISSAMAVRRRPSSST